MFFSTHVLPLVLGLIRILPAAADPPLPPDIDGFYKPEDDSWRDKDPGYIIDHRPVHLPWLIPGAESPLTAHQLLFVTRNASNEPTTSVTTVIRPQYANPQRLISYQIAYDSPDVNCSPSFGLQRDAELTATLWNQLQMAYVVPYLMSNKGLLGQRPFINVPDYEGNNAAFTVGPQSGYHTLDSIKAALNSQKYTGINPRAKAIMFGYSGGGLASEWASELHATHSPDLNIIAAAIGGPPPNVTNTYIHVNGTQSPLNIWAVLGVMNAFPEVDTFLRGDVKLDWGSYFLGPLSRCSRPKPKPPAIPGWANVTDWFKSGDEFLYKFKHILDENGVMGRRIEEGKRPNFPLYIFQGTDDNITAPIEDTDKLVERFCEVGTKVRYVRYVGKDHGATLIKGMYPAWTWMSARFNGFRVKKCTTKDVVKDGDDDGDDEDSDPLAEIDWDLDEEDEESVLRSNPLHEGDL
ncbi:secretory lipase-domain-containing protein [Aspergillus pseudoustus]|uniref:Secretory lipase-domain-containing protein n=1 Tax=Aspergillus pseudoustus TaxID=1810923 RepID=A0ABR4KDE4_9EURO